MLLCEVLLCTAVLFVEDVVCDSIIVVVRIQTKGSWGACGGGDSERQGCRAGGLVQYIIRYEVKSKIVVL